MKLLLNFIRTEKSLVGFDLRTKEAFWSLPDASLRTRGICFVEDGFITAGDSFVSKFFHSGEVKRFALPDAGLNEVHRVRVFKDRGIAVADSGNSRLLLFSRDFSSHVEYDALGGWRQRQPHVMHLNDAILTPRGIIASCFNYRPWRSIEGKEKSWWRNQGHGLILSLEKREGINTGKILACGLSCPHNLTWHNNRVWCCSSASGELVGLAFTPQGFLREEERVFITDKYFLRGLLPLEDGGFLLGGSVMRQWNDPERSGAAIFHLKADGKIEEHILPLKGEIYDIMPWDERCAALQQLDITM